MNVPFLQVRTGPDDQFRIDHNVLRGAATHEGTNQPNRRSPEAVERLMDRRQRRRVGVRPVDVIEANDPHVARNHSPALVDVAHRAQSELIVRRLNALRQSARRTHDVVAVT